VLIHDPLDDTQGLGRVMRSDSLQRVDGVGEVEPSRVLQESEDAVHVDFRIQVNADCTVWAFFIVVSARILHLFACVGEAREPVRVVTFRTEKRK